MPRRSPTGGAIRRRTGLARPELPRAAEQDRPDVAARRRQWRVWQRFMDPARFVFLEDTGTATNMTRRYGRSPSGQRLIAAVPHGHWRSTTFVAGLRQTGVVARLVRDGPPCGCGVPTAPRGTGTAFRVYRIVRLRDCGEAVHDPRRHRPPRAVRPPAPSPLSAPAARPLAHPYWWARLRENRAIIACVKAGRSSGLRLVTQLPSSTTSRSTQ